MAAFIEGIPQQQGPPPGARAAGRASPPAEARPRPPSEVRTSDGTLIGYATQSAEGYVFTQPEQLRGVRVHPPFRVASAPSGAGVATTLAEVLSGALGR